MVAVADKDVINKLTKTVEALMQTNVSLTAQLSHSINMNLEMSKN